MSAKLARHNKELIRLRALVLKELVGNLWHTTYPDRFQDILASGAILPESGIQNWKAVGVGYGEDCCSYAHKLGGVSLFDFDQFDQTGYETKYPLSSWDAFVPYLWDCGAVWIEIDREKVAPGLISASNLVDRWNSDKAYKHNIMPYVEAVYLGPLPSSAFKRAFLVREGENQFESLSLEK